MSKTLIKTVRKSFKTEFKTKPLMIFSPGRINLIGEHTDYNDGFVFPAAINKGIALAISKSNSKTSCVHALDANDFYEFDLEKCESLKNGGWKNYVLGVVAEIQKLDLKLENFNAVFSGNIPSGAGMSSSAALENSFVFGLNTLFNLGLSKRQMIAISQKAEHNFVGVKCGIMDQYASMFGKKNCALFLDCRTLESESFKIDFKSYKLVLINTNVKHELSESAYNDRRLVCETISKTLNIDALRDATLEDLNKFKTLISEEDFLKAKYIIQENRRVQLFAEAIKEGHLKALGELFYQSHDGLSKNYNVSCKELDFLVNHTKMNPSVLGARMMGGGFGGCTINLVLKSKLKDFKKRISKDYKKEFGRACSVYKVKLSKGTQHIN